MAGAAGLLIVAVFAFVLLAPLVSRRLSRAGQAEGAAVVPPVRPPSAGGMAVPVITDLHDERQAFAYDNGLAVEGIEGIMTAISGWAGSGAGLIAIGICAILAGIITHLPKFSHPWVHRFLIIGMYAGATAVLVTPIGEFALNLAHTAAGWFGGFGSGLGKVAIVLAGFFLLASVLIALIKVPTAAAASLAVFLAFVLALEPGGFLHQFYVVTSAPGQQFAAELSAWLGG